MLSSEPTPRHPVVPNPFVRPPQAQAQAQAQPAPSNIRAYSYNEDDSDAMVSVHPPDEKNPFENRIRSQSAQSESEITTGSAPSNAQASNESEATTQLTRSAQPAQPAQPVQPAQSDISTRSVNQESLREFDATTQSSQSETNHPAPETTTQPLNDATAKDSQSSTAVPAPSSAKDQAAPADTPADSKAQDSNLETDIIAQQDPAVVHPDHSNLNYDPKTGEGLAIEMEIHAIKAAIEAGLIPPGTSVERDAVARGEHVSEKNKEAFRKAQQQPDATAKNLEQKENESKQMDNMVGMTKDELVKTKDGRSESKTDEVEPRRDVAAEVKEE